MARRIQRLTGYALSALACLILRCCSVWCIKSHALLAFSSAQKSEQDGAAGLPLSIQTLWPPKPGTLRRDLVVILAFAVLGYVVSYQKQRFRAAPHIDMISPTLPSPGLGALYVAALYGTNIAYNVLNKRLLTAHPCPIVITTVNFGTCSAFCICAWLLHVQPRPSRITASLLVRMIPLALLHWLGLLSANISLAEVDVAFAHTLKASEPLFTAAIVMVMEWEMPSLRVMMSLLVVAAGVGMASLTEVSFTWVGFWSAMASNVVVSIRSVMSKRLIASKEEDPANLIAMLHAMAFVLSLPALLVSRHSVLEFRDALADSSANAMIPLIGLQMCLFQVASIMVLSKTTPLAHSMIRTLRRPCLIIASVIVFHTPVKAANAVGVVLALLGAWLYQGSLELHGTQLMRRGLVQSKSNPQMHDAIHGSPSDTNLCRSAVAQRHHVHVSTIT
mmetsp:Transcript_20047/g.36213  ORF Transcript_20047/g.36213 Transcript_20047/m.36213 type:complete len:447 (+) Transcript_20047:71-1411(+)